jgi:hypothetical protein
VRDKDLFKAASKAFKAADLVPTPCFPRSFLLCRRWDSNPYEVALTGAGYAGAVGRWGSSGEGVGEGDGIFGQDMKLDNEQLQEWFPAPAYTDDTYARRGEPTTLWLQRSTVVRAVAWRRFLNENLSVLPRAHQSVLYQALHDRWHSAFFELIVARTLQVLGADIEVEPDSEAGTRIDFLARFPDRPVSVEAVAPVINAAAGKEAKRRCGASSHLQVRAPSEVQRLCCVPLAVILCVCTIIDVA